MTSNIGTMPTIGRQVWYFENWNNEVIPMTALICYVWNERLVNLVITNPNGEQTFKSSVEYYPYETVKAGAGVEMNNLVGHWDWPQRTT